jgi:hypothetical protein
VLYARVPYWSGDAPAYADALAQLLRTCRLKARRVRSTSDRQMWAERGARLGLIAASNFIETKVGMSPTRSASLPLCLFLLLPRCPLCRSRELT